MKIYLIRGDYELQPEVAFKTKELAREYLRREFEETLGEYWDWDRSIIELEVVEEELQ